MANRKFELQNLKLQEVTADDVEKILAIPTVLCTDDIFELNLESSALHQTISKEKANVIEEAETLQCLLKSEPVLQPCAYDQHMPRSSVLSDMHKEVLGDCLRQRREQIADLLLEQKALCEELSEEPRPLKADPLPTQEELDEFRKHLQFLKDEREQRKKKLNSIRHETRKLLDILDVSCLYTMNNLLYGSKIKLDKDTFNVLERLHDRCVSLQKTMKIQIEIMLKRLEILWEELATSPAIRNEFRKYTEYNWQIYHQFIGEFKRCEKLKELTLKNAQIIKKFNNRRGILQEIFELKPTECQTSRFNNRGHEEKKRKILERKLANIDTEISTLVKAFEERTGKPFLIDGVNIYVVMNREWESKQQLNKQISSALKPVPEAAATTSFKRRPMALKNGRQMTASTAKKRELAAVADKRSPAGGHLSGGRNNKDDAGIASSDGLDLTKALKKSIQISGCPRIGSTAAAGRTPRLRPILGAGKENAPVPNTKK